MNRSRHDVSLTILQWTLGVIVFVLSCMTFRGAIMDLRAAEHIHHLLLARLLLSSVEAIAAILFLIPTTLRAAGWTLIVIFICAIVVHTLSGSLRELPLVIYGAAVYAVMTWKGQTKA
jgi:uncharacterized membrane protein YphA (DoxX/SURF4 family)